MTPSHAAYGLFCRLQAATNWMRLKPTDAEIVLLNELISIGWIRGEKLYEPKQEKETNPRHKLLVESWCLAWAEHFQNQYKFSGRDARAASELLAQGLAPHEVIELAERAWSFGLERKNAWACEQSVTLWGFAAHLNKIRVEVGAVQQGRNGEGLRAKVL